MHISHFYPNITSVKYLMFYKIFVVSDWSDLYLVNIFSLAKCVQISSDIDKEIGMNKFYNPKTKYLLVKNTIKQLHNLTILYVTFLDKNFRK